VPIVGALFALTACSQAQSDQLRSGEATLTEGRSLQLVDGSYGYSLVNCRGANTFLLIGRVRGGSQSVANFSSDESGRLQRGQQWIQAGTYSGKSQIVAVKPCGARCIPIVTSEQDLSGCGWSLTLKLVRAGGPP